MQGDDIKGRRLRRRPFFDIVPTRLGSEWCVGIYRTRADLPLMQSSLSTDVPMEEAVDEAKQKIDRTLSLDH